MQVLSIIDEQAITEALRVLNSGGIVIYPTETCYGVGVDATNSTAVTKLLSYKKRPAGKAISIACSSREMAQKHVEINPSAKHIYKDFLPGAVTVISQSKHVVDNRLESELGTIGIRIPAYTFLLELIDAFGKPITSTSANSAGQKTPYKIDDIFDFLSSEQKSLIDLVIDAGELPQNPPTTVIDTTTTDLKVYRQGGIDPTRN